MVFQSLLETGVTGAEHEGVKVLFEIFFGKADSTVVVTRAKTVTLH